MTSDHPAWTPAEPGMPPALPQEEGRAGCVVALVATEGALAGGWVGAVAVDCAAGWSGSGARVVLADAGLSTPTVHEALGLPNHEGLVDALRWGASVQHVVRRAEGRAFFAVTAGTAVADPAQVLAEPRWAALCAGFRDAGVTLAVVVPAWENGLAAVLAEADAIVILADADEDVAFLVREAGAPVVAVTGRKAGEQFGGADAGAGPSGVAVDDTVAVEPEPDVSVPTDPVVGDSDDRASGAPVDGSDMASSSGVEDGDSQADDSPAVAGWGSPADVGAPLSVDESPVDPDPDPLFADLEPDPFLAAPDPDRLFADLEPDPLLAAPDPDPLFADLELDLLPAAPDPDRPFPGLERNPLFADVEAEIGGGVSDPAGVDDDFVLPEPIPVPPSFEEIVEESEAPPRRGRGGRLLVLALVVLGAVAGAAWLGYIEVPGITPDREAPSAAQPVTPTVAEEVSASETSGLLGYSLSLGAYQDSIVARERVGTLSAQVPRFLFMLVPVEVDGALYHRVMAGPATDSAGAVALAGDIAAVTGLDPSGWVARWTPKAFQLGEMADRETADRRVEALWELGVGAYVLAVDYSDGSHRYRVYAGAFADASEASHLLGLLAERGLSSAPLSDRTGRLPE